MIPRRAFLIGLGVTGFAPLLARAQPPGKLARVGYISTLPEGFLLADAWRKAFVDGLREHGWVENQNVVKSNDCARENAVQVSASKDYGIVIADLYKVCLKSRG